MHSLVYETGADLGIANMGRTPHLNGKHVVFGEVSEGMDVLGMIEKTGAGGIPKKPVKIDVSGQL